MASSGKIYSNKAAGSFTSGGTTYKFTDAQWYVSWSQSKSSHGQSTVSFTVWTTKTNSSPRNLTAGGTITITATTGSIASGDTSLSFTRTGRSFAKSGGNNYIQQALADDGAQTFSFKINHTNAGAAAFNVAFNMNCAGYTAGGGGSATLDTNHKDFTLTLSKGTGISTVSGGGTKQAGSSVTATASLSTGYNFSKWTDSAGTSKSTSTSYTFTMPTSNYTLTANATAKTMTVTYNANGGTVSPASKSVTYGSTYGTLATPSYTGRTFNGWYTAASGGTKITSSTTVSQTANHTIYAHWSLITYEIKYNANGGKSTPTTQTKNYGTAITVAADPGHDPDTKTVTTTFNANGGSVSPTSRTSSASKPYVFAGWKATDGTIYQPGSKYTKNEGTTLTAQWTIRDWIGNTVSLPTPTNAGHSFNGWYTAASGGTKVTSHKPTSDTTLYAQWTPLTYNIVVYDQFSGATLLNQDISYGSSITLPALSAEPYYMLAADMDLVFDDSSGYLNTESVHINGYQKLFPLYYYNDRDGATWTTTYTHTYSDDVVLYLTYEPVSSYDIDVIEFQALEQVKNKENILAYWTRVTGPSWLPIKVTPGSVVKLDVQLSEDAFYDGEYAEYDCVYEPTALNYVWVKNNGTYQLGTPLFKFNSKFDHNNYYFIKKDGEWTNLLRWLNKQAAAEAEAAKAAKDAAEGE